MLHLEVDTITGGTKFALAQMIPIAIPSASDSPTTLLFVLLYDYETCLDAKILVVKILQDILRSIEERVKCAIVPRFLNLRLL